MYDLTPMDNFLTRPQIDSIIESMTSRDLFAAMPSGTEVKGAQIAAEVFEKAAERQGYGPQALDRIRIPDAVYMAGKLGEVFQDGPKDEATEDSPASPDSGD